MNLAQLEYLAEVAKTGSYSQAGRNLYMTPQAISKSITELERDLGAKLVEKEGRGIRLTPFALEVAKLGEETLQRISDIRCLAQCQEAPASEDECA